MDRWNVGLHKRHGTEEKTAARCNGVGGGSYGQRYRRWTAPLRTNPAYMTALRRLDNLLKLLFYGAYGVLALVVVLEGASLKLVPLGLIPAAGFGLLSLVRRRLNRPRPYELYDLNPLIERDGSGESFPSRHAFSAFTIAAAWFSTAPLVATFLLVAACLVGVCRVLGGVHFPRDVVAGALAGVVTGTLTAVAIAVL